MPRSLSNPAQKSLFDAFLATLLEATGGSVEQITYEVPIGDSAVDVVIDFVTPDGRWTVPVELMREAYPRDVRRVVWSLDGYRARYEGAAPIVPMVVADRLSQGARGELKVRNIGYYDSSGSMYLRQKRWLINIERAHTAAKKQHTVQLFTGSREKVVHALLQTDGNWFTGDELALTSETSAFTVSGVLHELERREWIVESEGRGRYKRRRLAKPGLLLDAWAEAWQKKKQLRSYWYLFCSNSKELLTKVAWKTIDANIEPGWAFTGSVAANFVSPLLTSVEIAEVAVSPELLEIFSNTLGLKPAEKGYNVVLIERTGAGLLFRKEHEGAWFSSNFIQYLDLLDGRGRNAELAAQFRRDILEI